MGRPAKKSTRAERRAEVLARHPMPARPENIPEDIYDRCLVVTSPRVRLVLAHILEHGSIATPEIEEKYGHGPRAICDTRDLGIPLTTKWIRWPDGKRYASYSLATAEDKDQYGRIGGRRSIPKGVKEALIKRHGSRDFASGKEADPSSLSVDHRVPFLVGGDPDDMHAVDAFMLLDRSSQRSKSFECEACPNSQDAAQRSVATCQTCFWAHPEDYSHRAMAPGRTVSVLLDQDSAERLAELQRQHGAATAEAMIVALIRGLV